MRGHGFLGDVIDRHQFWFLKSINKHLFILFRRRGLVLTFFSSSDKQKRESFFESCYLTSVLGINLMLSWNLMLSPSLPHFLPLSLTFSLSPSLFPSPLSLLLSLPHFLTRRPKTGLTRRPKTGLTRRPKTGLTRCPNPGLTRLGWSTF